MPLSQTSACQLRKFFEKSQHCGKRTKFVNTVWPNFSCFLKGRKRWCAGLHKYGSSRNWRLSLFWFWIYLTNCCVSGRDFFSQRKRRPGGPQTCSQTVFLSLECRGITKFLAGTFLKVYLIIVLSYTVPVKVCSIWNRVFIIIFRLFKRRTKRFLPFISYTMPYCYESG